MTRKDYDSEEKETVLVPRVVSVEDMLNIIHEQNQEILLKLSNMTKKN